MVASAARDSTAAVLLGFGWDDTAWPEQRPFSRAELDRATGGRAAMLARVDVHSAVVSSAFLDACPDVVHAEGYDVGGLVARDAHHAARAGLFRLQSAAFASGGRGAPGAAGRGGPPRLRDGPRPRRPAHLSGRRPNGLRRPHRAAPSPRGGRLLGRARRRGPASRSGARGPRATSAWTAPSGRRRQASTRRTPMPRPGDTSTWIPRRWRTTSWPARGPVSRRAST